MQEEFLKIGMEEQRKRGKEGEKMEKSRIK